MTTYGYYIATSKTGKSAALRCPFCGEVAIFDELVTDSEESIEYITVKSESTRTMACRICGSGFNSPASVKPITWEEFDYALASEDLIEKTNPEVRNEEVPTLAEVGLPPIENEPRAAVALLYLLTRHLPREGNTIVALFVTVIAVALTYAFGHSIQNIRYIAAAVGVTGLIGCVIVYQIMRAKSMADLYYTHVERYARESGQSMDDLVAIARRHPALKRAILVLKEIAKDV